MILKDSSCKYNFDDSIANIISFNMKHPIDYLKSIYHLATATTVLVDTYFGFLAVTNFRPGTTCIQLWHAAGAIKHFGLQDPSNETRSQRAIDRFQQVYDRFDYTVVGSEKMADTFRESFGITNNRILRTGVPRSDILFNQEKKQQIYHYIHSKYPLIGDKKIILYTPTFREDQFTDYQLELDIPQMYRELSDEYVLFIKLHPAVSNYVISEEFDDFVYDVSDYKDTNELLLITDLLISDYSSIPFEYAILEKPMIFFAYDMEQYKITSGLINDYGNQMPGPVVSTTYEIIYSIREKAFDMNQIQSFKEQWNEYSTGNSSINLARFLAGVEEKEETKEKVFI
ncbi:CDP-glycerol glycerophosphotransferase family protein [Oceanobacillus massiliensis]|uniref:CDP-glycerol glycerophosphotransferase family protein n=2 Tax=Oceanobacillus massiliensis TaxID=1465765 RepID=UPI0021C34608|nr:CDP-glycerol glycerophosphotransferase family protein [Oceanobacillus massiliensis]